MLGRLPALDFRDRQFLLSPPEATEIDRMHRYWITSKALDQKRKPHCVSFSGHQFLLSSPVKNIPFGSTQELYDLCQANDEWEGTDYDGTSVRALMKVFKDKGLISKYEWAYNLDVAIRHIITTSPLILGISWDRAMFEPFVYQRSRKDKPAVFIKAGGGNAGGHAITWSGINLEKPCWCGDLGVGQLTNSWSENWGHKGRVYMCLKEIGAKIADWGEAACPTELKFRPVG